MAEDAAQQILKPLIGAQAIKHRVHFQLTQPLIAPRVRLLEPSQRLMSIVQPGVNGGDVVVSKNSIDASAGPQCTS